MPITTPAPRSAPSVQAALSRRDIPGSRQARRPLSALAPRPNPTGPARLDRPQRLWILPTSAFWKRPDVWRLVRLPTFVFLLFWFPALDLLLPDFVPRWGHGLLGGLGPYLFVGLLERYVRRRMTTNSRPSELATISADTDGGARHKQLPLRPEPPRATRTW